MNYSNFLFKLLLTIVLALNISFVSARHPVHLTVVHMQLNKSTKTLDYSIRLFQDDINNLLGALVHVELHKGIPESVAYSDTTLIPKYFQRSFKVNGDNKYISPKLIRKDYKETEVWLYYSANLSEIPDVITIENRIYLELYLDQTNMLIFSCGDKEKGLTFDMKNTKQNIALNNI